MNEDNSGEIFFPARFYSSVKFIKPASSRSDSSEKFLLARGYKGLVK